MTDAWICLGSSASAPAMLPVAMRDYPDVQRITTNSGLKLMRPPLAPHYYFLSDHIACKEFAAEAMDLRHTHGMHVITLGRVESAITGRGLTAVDYLIHQGRPARPCDFERGTYLDCMFSGIYCVQFALFTGRAKTIVAVGHEGYPDNEVDPCYWDGGAPVNKKQALAYTTNWIGPWWRNAVAACPDVTFHFYGRQRFAIDGPNVRKTENASAIPALLAANEMR